MSRLRPGDGRLHYCDSSHRWIAPRGVDQGVWEAGVRAHLAQHRATMGAPAEPETMPPPYAMPKRCVAHVDNPTTTL